jgi:hypothetical protein
MFALIDPTPGEILGVAIAGRVVDVSPVQYPTRRPRQWKIAPAGASTSWIWDGQAIVPEPLEVRRKRVAMAIDAKAQALLDRGAPASAGSPADLRFIQVGDGSRADLTGMAATAGDAIAGLVPWPDSYAQGWIAADNSRIALPTPADGLALAAGVGAWYATVVQNRRSLKDMALASDEPEAIDTTQGWPA